MSRRVRVKFCGFTRVQDVHPAVALGVDAVGLVLTPRSKRCIDMPTALAIRTALPPFVSVVALFMDDEPDHIRRAVQTLKPDLLQFHGAEDAADCMRYGCRYLKAIAMGSVVDVAAAMAAHPAAAAFLLDSHVAGGAGGSGAVFDWTQAPREAARAIVLAGGLTCDNVGPAIRAVRPYAVDVSSGIESAPGIKDADKMRRFIEEVERAGSQS